jgi:hypothetical protein
MTWIEIEVAIDLVTRSYRSPPHTGIKANFCSRATVGVPCLPMLFPRSNAECFRATEAPEFSLTRHPRKEGHRLWHDKV